MDRMSQKNILGCGTIRAFVRAAQQLVRSNAGGTMMRSGKIIASILGVLGVLGVCWLAQRAASQAAGQAPARRKRIAIAASTVLDGKGRVLHDTRIVVEGAKIAAMETKVDPGAGPADYDLRGLTVLPGWIDAHG